MSPFVLDRRDSRFDGVFGAQRGARQTPAEVRAQRDRETVDALVVALPEAQRHDPALVAGLLLARFGTDLATWPEHAHRLTDLAPCTLDDVKRAAELQRARGVSAARANDPAVLAAVNTLRPRQRQVLQLLWGTTGKLHTLNGVALKLGITRERARIIQTEALDQLRADGIDLGN